jgi:hypothetical protein
VESSKRRGDILCRRGVQQKEEGIYFVEEESSQKKRGYAL